MMTGEATSQEGRETFWAASGYSLLAEDDAGRLAVTPEFVSAWLHRPEMQPIETSCDAEIALLEQLKADPLRDVSDAELAHVSDADAVDNFRVFLAFRDHLTAARTVEAAYVALTSAGAPAMPAIFLDQLVHVILRHVLRTCSDPIRLRASEIFFREQNVSLDDGRVMLADTEVVELYARNGGLGSLGQLLAESGTPQKQVELDVLAEENAAIYWGRSDSFDTVIDFRFGLPSVDGFARTLEAFTRHLTGHDVRVTPQRQIDDEDWRWHVGLDPTSNGILNRLYEGADVPLEERALLLGLFDLRFVDEAAVIERLRGHPVHLALGMSAEKRVRMKPHNILHNLPLAAAS